MNALKTTSKYKDIYYVIEAKHAMRQENYNKEKQRPILHKPKISPDSIKFEIITSVIRTKDKSTELIALEKVGWSLG